MIVGATKAFQSEGGDILGSVRVLFLDGLLYIKPSVMAFEEALTTISPLYFSI